MFSIMQVPIMNTICFCKIDANILASMGGWVSLGIIHFNKIRITCHNIRSYKLARTCKTEWDNEIGKIKPTLKIREGKNSLKVFFCREKAQTSPTLKSLLLLSFEPGIMFLVVVPSVFERFIPGSEGKWKKEQRSIVNHIRRRTDNKRRFKKVEPASDKWGTRISRYLYVTSVICPVTHKLSEFKIKFFTWEENVRCDALDTMYIHR